MYPGDLAGGFSDLEMTWLLYCAAAATKHRATLLCQGIELVAMFVLKLELFAHCELVHNTGHDMMTACVNISTFVISVYGVTLGVYELYVQWSEGTCHSVWGSVCRSHIHMQLHCNVIRKLDTVLHTTQQKY